MKFKCYSVPDGRGGRITVRTSQRPTKRTLTALIDAANAANRILKSSAIPPQADQQKKLAGTVNKETPNSEKEKGGAS